MRKEYEVPVAEKMEFDYTETVVASDVQSSEKYNEDTQYFKCPCTSYFAGGWGNNC